MTTIIYLKEISTVKKMLGFLLLFLGIFVLLTNIIFGAIFSVIGINLLMTEGSEINLETNTYRTIKSLFGIHFGKWKKCPNFEYISVFKTTENQTIRVITAEATLQSTIILINLFYNGNKHLTFYKTTNKEDAFKVAATFKSFLHLDILDATSSEKKWL